MLKLEKTDKWTKGETVVVSTLETVAEQRSALEEIIFSRLLVDLRIESLKHGKYALRFVQGKHQIKAMERLIRELNDEARADAFAVDGKRL